MPKYKIAVIASFPKVDWIRLQLDADSTILDVGCADGKVWDKNIFDVITLDREERSGDEPCHPDVIGDANNLPFDDNSFDIVCLTEILEHVESPIQVLKEAYRVARLKVVITVPWEEVWPVKYMPFQNPEHVRFYTPELLVVDISTVSPYYQLQGIEFSDMYWIGTNLYCCKGKIWNTKRTTSR